MVWLLLVMLTAGIMVVLFLISLDRYDRFLTGYYRMFIRHPELMAIYDEQEIAYKRFYTDADFDKRLNEACADILERSSQLLFIPLPVIGTRQLWERKIRGIVQKSSRFRAAVEKCIREERYNKFFIHRLKCCLKQYE